MATETFHFEHIPESFDETQYIALRSAMTVAARLFGDGLGQELGNNIEYERGIVEFICDYIGLPMYLKENVLAEICAIALETNK